MAQPQHDRRIDYIEFPVPDVGTAKRFYGDVFGWKFTDYGPDYTSFEDGRLSGGFRGGETPAAGGPLIVIYAVDLEAVARAVQGAGGRITQPTFDFPGGRRFHFRDPSGHELAVWSDPTA
jgi:predicted enzyme related to lactoylglutathione lyase